MGVNLVVDNASSQQMAVALSSNLAVELKQLDQRDRTDSGKQKVHAESNVSKLIQDGTNPSKAGMNILLGLVSKLATLGVNLKPDGFSGKAKETLENEYSRLLGGEENFEDRVDIKNLITKIGERKQNQNSQNKNAQGEDGGIILDQEGRASVREYAAVYTQYIVNNSAELKKKLDKIEGELRKKGLSQKDFTSIRTIVKGSIRKEIAQQVKDAFLKKVLSPEKSIEMVISEKGLNDVLDFAILRGIHDNESLQSVADEVVSETRDEIRDFAREKIEEKLVSKHLASSDKAKEKISNELKELLKLGAKVGLDLNEFVKNWGIKKFDLGLYIPDIPLGPGGSQANPDSQNQNKSPYEFTKEDEKDLLIGRLRALYMHRALSGDWKTYLETSFKMHKLKNGLIKLGVKSGDFDKIEKEGRAAARLRLLDMLKQTLEERATLYELAGPAFKLIEQKIKSLLSNLERLDGKLSEGEFNSLRDSANLRVYAAAKNELVTLSEMIKASSNPGLEKRYSLVVKLLKRLQQESNLKDEIPDDSFLVKEAV